MALFQRGQRSQPKQEILPEEIQDSPPEAPAEIIHPLLEQETVSDISDASPVTDSPPADSPPDVLYPGYESPTEEKIHDLISQNNPVERPADTVLGNMDTVDGWHPIGEHILTQPSRSGMPFYLSETSDSQGVLAYWKRTRAFSPVSKRYEPCGKWVDFLTGEDIKFEPKFWRERFV